MTGLWRRVAAALPDLALACACGAAVVGAVPPAVADNLWRAAVLEFFVIHASGFLMVTWLTGWSLGRRAAYVAFLAFAYTVAMAVVAWVVRGLWPLGIFWGLMANRMLGAIVDEAPRGERQDELTHAWAGATTLFAVAAAVAGVAGASRTAVLVAAALYFAGVGVSELTGWRWVFRWMAAARARGR